MRNTYKKIGMALCGLGLAISLNAQSGIRKEAQNSTDVFEQLLRNIVVQETTGIDVATLNLQTRKYLTLLNNNGAFRDINYTSHAQTGWQPAEHVLRLKEMVISYVTPESKLFGDSALQQNIINMLQYWEKVKPTSTNWWYHEIGWAQPMGLSLILMRSGVKPVPLSLENQIVEYMDRISKGPAQKGSQGTGANKMDIALQWIYRTCLQEDISDFEFAIEQFFYPIKMNNGQGIQSDFSYLQHGQQLYTGGYGAAVLKAFLKVASYLRNTPYENKQKLALMSNFVRFGYLPTIRGQHMLYNVLGRGIGRTDATRCAGLGKQLEKLAMLDSEHTDIYHKSIKRINGKAAPNYEVEPAHWHYWRADHTIHQRPEYTMDVRMASTRTMRCENGNGENLKGYFLTEGGTAIVRTGNEYDNIFPSWDWSHIPGTTTPALKEIPLPGPWGQYGQSNFSGGVSDGIYGVTTYHMKDENFQINTSAKKSWFFFDKEVVCMGCDIQSSNALPIHTTVNQCLLKGDVTFVTKNQDTKVLIPKGITQFHDLVCVNHDSISYYFPQGGNLFVQNESQTGSWKDLSRHLSATPIRQNIFKLWLDHGVSPQEENYIYYVVPNTATAKEAICQIDDLLTINDKNIQAVFNLSRHLLQIVFHTKGNIKIGDVEISSNTPCVVMLTNLNTDKVRAFVADPSHQLSATRLTLSTPYLKNQKSVDVPFNTQELYKGSTTEILF